MMTNRKTTVHLSTLLLAGLAWLLPLHAGASLIASDGSGDEISVFLEINESSAVTVFDQTVTVSNGVELETTVDMNWGSGEPDDNDLLDISLDILADGFLLTMDCRSIILGCELPHDPDTETVGFTLSLGDLDWLDIPGQLTGVDLVFGGGFISDGVTVLGSTVTSNSYIATFSESSLGTSSTDPGTVTGTFLVRHAVPEPATWLLVLLGLGFVVTWNRHPSPASHVRISSRR